MVAGIVEHEEHSPSRGMLAQQSLEETLECRSVEDGKTDLFSWCKFCPSDSMVLGYVDDIGESEPSDIPHRRLSRRTYPHQRDIFQLSLMERKNG